MKYSTEAYKLAIDLAKYAREFDLYEYNDMYENDEDAIDATLKEIFNGKENVAEELKEMIETYERELEELRTDEIERMPDIYDDINKGKDILNRLIKFESEETK